MSDTRPPKKRLHQHIAHHAKHWFIPHVGNDHKPHALRPVALRAYAYILITAKVLSAVFLFAAYPNQAHFAAYTSSTVIALTNQSRADAKVAALKENSLLAQAAQRKAKDILARNYFSHTTPDGKRFWTWIDGAGYSYTLAGENLAIDFTTPESAHAALLASPTHKANILNARYKEIGVAVVTGQMDGQETTVLVEMFGTPAPQKTTVAKVTTPKKTTTTQPTTKPATPTKPTTTTKPAVPVTPTPAVQAAETPKPTANLVQQSYESFTAPPASTVSVWAEFRNSGDTTWKASSLTLVTANPTKHDSPLAHATWENASVVSDLAADVPASEVARFEWTLTTPESEEATNESFALIDATGTLVPSTTVKFTVNVKRPETVAASAPTPTQTDVANPSPETSQEPAPVLTAPSGWSAKILNFVDKFYLGFVFFLLLALGLNIFVKIRVQHAHVIGQTLAVLVIAAASFLVKFHFLEGMAKAISVL